MNSIRLIDQVIDCGNLVNGQWIMGTAGTSSVLSPYSGKAIGKLALSSAADVDAAVTAAEKASPGWGRTPIKERSQVLYEFRKILLRDIDAISNRISIESGKTLAEARAGLMKGVEVLEFALSVQNLGDTGKMEVSRGISCEYRREPLGVVAGITPFNFPAMVPMWMIPLALIAGNSFVWKPSDKTPLTSILIGNALLEAGLPPGVLTVVQGGRQAVEAILVHPKISAVGFVGSSPVARTVYQRGTSHGKRVLALGGAKNSIILLPDADPEISSRAIADSFTGCAGQRCMASSLLLAVKGSEAILEEVIKKAAQIKLGDDMGAIITKESREKLLNALGRATQDGAKLALDGRTVPAPKGFEGGNWLAPSIIDSVSPGSQAACEELFGPVLSVIRCGNLSQALEIDNSSPFGNATSVFTSSGAVAERVAQEAHCGMIGVNVGVPVPREPFSFGGTRESRFGHGDITGVAGLDFWSQHKKVTMKWALQQPSRDQNSHATNFKWLS